MLARLILLLALVATPQAWAQSPGQGMDYGRYHALVIGNNDYLHLPKLKTAIADAQGVADVFGSRYGFSVELLLNADRDQIVRAIAQYRALKDSDNLIIYYAGHGVLDRPRIGASGCPSMPRRITRRAGLTLRWSAATSER